MSAAEIQLKCALALVDSIWARMSDGILLRQALGRPVERFPDLSEEAAACTAHAARLDMAAIDAVDSDLLPHELALTLKIARFQLAIEAQAVDRYWLAQNYGFLPSMFPAGSYGGGYVLNAALKVFSSFVFHGVEDAERYLLLIDAYAHFVDQMKIKLQRQATRGIRIPQAALPSMRAMMAGQATAAHKKMLVNPLRLAGVPRSWVESFAKRIEEKVTPAFAALLDVFDNDYAIRAPQAVGLAQFDGGEAAYEALIAEHLSMPMSVESVHRAGLDGMSRLEEQMAQLRAQLGYTDRETFHLYLKTDPAWVARTPEQLQSRFDDVIRRIEPRIDGLFRFKPKARYRAARLDRELEGGMTAGFYQAPKPGHPDGVYYYNGANVAERTLAGAASLIYHELIPGHHFHMASQKENKRLHPLRRHLMFNAFNEGWAEYAATLAGENDLYEPCERYGRLLKEAYYTCRLVVDTGMNALGWPLERACQYMRDHALLSESEIHSETLRYATDIPAQSLAYKLGEVKMRQLRERAQVALGGRFDIRDFHDVVLGSGGMPLEVLDWHVNCWLGSVRMACSR